MKPRHGSASPSAMPAVKISTLFASGPIHQLVDPIRGVYRNEDSSENRTSPLELGVCAVPVRVLIVKHLVDWIHLVPAVSHHHPYTSSLSNSEPK